MADPIYKMMEDIYMYWWIVELPDDDFGMVQADDEDIARDMANEEYGDKWLYIHRDGDIQNDMNNY